MDIPHTPSNIRCVSLRPTGLAWLVAALLLASACSAGSTPTTNEGDSAPEGPLTVTLVLEGRFGRSVRVSGFVVWDDQRARLCQDLLESFPPQCGQPSMTIANPEDLDLSFDEQGDVRWTPSSIEVDGSWDGNEFTIR